MQANNFNIHFLNQFHQECIGYPGKKVQQFKTLLFRQFGGRKHEISRLVPSVEQKLEDSEVICRLMTQLENENIPDYFKLSNFARRFKRDLSSYVMNEHFTTKYYKMALGILEPFIRLIDDFNEKTQQLLFNRLKALPKAEKHLAKNTSISSEEADDLIVIMGQFLDYLYDYYNDFNSSIDRDSDGLKGIAFPTNMEQHMTNLVSLIEKLMYDTKSTQTLLQGWKTQLANRELQAIYN
jgi:hypothetical protein